MVSQELMFVFSCTYMGFVFSTLLFGLPPLKASGSVFEFYYWEIFPHVTPWVYPISLSAQTASAYMTLCVTIERYVAVCQVILYCNYHIFQKAQVTSFKMEPKKRHSFSWTLTWCGSFCSDSVSFCNHQIKASHWLIEEF